MELNLTFFFDINVIIHEGWLTLENVLLIFVPPHSRFIARRLHGKLAHSDLYIPVNGVKTLTEKTLIPNAGWLWRSPPVVIIITHIARLTSCVTSGRLAALRPGDPSCTRAWPHQQRAAERSTSPKSPQRLWLSGREEHSSLKTSFSQGHGTEPSNAIETLCQHFKAQAVGTLG